MARKILALFLLSGLFLYSCGSGGSTNEIKIDGSSTVFPITEAVAEEYRSEAPNTRVTVGLSGTGGGFQKFLRGETDINDASREITPSEIKTAEENGVDYINFSFHFMDSPSLFIPKKTWLSSLKFI